ncbi:hypothetical protein E2562_023765 [Oryza meyeriana var. granulata]|uniref:DWNN domain-containing protein n=1 Tax=Oryza meyeriana var. granulata TaxID=110450 RepID=A0A6G1DMJ9_9ORYZ|nr:hypothetical protein E2562_023765 [Oryza meyeriana var. granulata]
MAVYYRYKSGVDTFSVPLSESSVSISELKRLIMATARCWSPGTRPCPGALPRVLACVPGYFTRGPRSCPGTSPGDRPRPGAVIDAAKLKWEAPSQGTHCYGNRSAHAARPPPAGYVCHRCRVPGHFIQHCPTNGDPRFDIRRAVPTPASSPAPAASGDPDGVIPAELYCKICRKVMADAVLASKCCFDSFCDRCIRDQMAAKSRCACGVQARADDLIPNPTLRTTIANLLATTSATSASSGTEQPRSSAGSNATEPPPQSPAASQASGSNVTSVKTECSDGSASTSKKSGTISGVHGPRKARETAGDYSAESGARAVDGNHHAAYGIPFCPAPGYVDPYMYYGGMPFGADPYMYYGDMHFGCGGAPNGYYGGEARIAVTGRGRASLPEPDGGDQRGAGDVAAGVWWLRLAPEWLTMMKRHRSIVKCCPTSEDPFFSSFCVSSWIKIQEDTN